ncbi:MAG: tetratricopeptide repeat protein [Spirochaetota bacterium]
MMRRADRCVAPIVVAVLLSLSVSGCTTTLSREELATEYYNIGSAYFELDELDKSATYLARAIELSPELARASYNLARVYVLQRRHDEAIELLELPLSEDPDNVLVMETIAYVYFDSGDVASAAQWYERAIEESPTDVDLLENRAVVALEDSDYERAVEVVRRAIEIDPTRAGLYRTLAETERERGDMEAALYAYENYLETASEPAPTALFDYGELLESGEFYADAIDVLGRIAEITGAPRELQARAEFARGRLLLTKAEEVESGVDAIRAAVSLGFEDAEAVRGLLDHPGLSERGESTLRVELEDLFQEAGLLGEGEGGAEDEPPAGAELQREPSDDSSGE